MIWIPFNDTNRLHLLESGKCLLAKDRHPCTHGRPSRPCSGVIHEPPSRVCSEMCGFSIRTRHADVSI